MVTYAKQNNTDVIAIDEGQFFHDIADAANTLANRGAHVVIAALDSNFLNHPSSRYFGNISELLPR